MEVTKVKIGKKGGAKRVTEKIKAIRETPVSRETLKIVETPAEVDKAPVQKIAGPKIELNG